MRSISSSKTSGIGIDPAVHAAGLDQPADLVFVRSNMEASSVEGSPGRSVEYVPNRVKAATMGAVSDFAAGYLIQPTPSNTSECIAPEGRPTRPSRTAIG